MAGKRAAAACMAHHIILVAMSIVLRSV
jgi:hypothetical protein